MEGTAARENGKVRVEGTAARERQSGILLFFFLLFFFQHRRSVHLPTCPKYLGLVILAEYPVLPYSHLISLSFSFPIYTSFASHEA